MMRSVQIQSKDIPYLKLTAVYNFYKHILQTLKIFQVDVTTIVDIARSAVLTYNLQKLVNDTNYNSIIFDNLKFDVIYLLEANERVQPFFCVELILPLTASEAAKLEFMFVEKLIENNLDLCNFKIGFLGVN